MLGVTVTAIATVVVAEIQRQPSAPAFVNPPPSPTPTPTPTPRPSPTPTTIISTISRVVLTTTAPTPSIDPYAYHLVENMAVGSCLSYWGASAGPGTCATPGDTDGWRYYMPQPDGPFELINKYGGYCLGEQSVKPAVATCNGAPGQQWRRGYVSSNSFSFVNMESGLCLAATGSSNQSTIQSTIELESCDKQLNEVWRNDGMI